MVASQPPSTVVTPEMMIPELLQRFPQTREVFNRHGLEGCGGRFGPVESIGFFARAHGVDQRRLLTEIHQVIDRPPAVIPAPRPLPIPRPGVGDTLYRRFFIGGIVLILTAGATWGAWLLWQIGFTGEFTAVSAHHVNAHGHAQIYGWVGLFIMGFAYQAFPRIWHTRVPAPRWAVVAFILMAIGMILRTAGMTLVSPASLAVPLAMIGGAMEMLSVVIFSIHVIVIFHRGEETLQPYVAFIFGALFWFVAQGALDLFHTWKTMTATTHEALVWYISTYQAPLRDLQIHGLAMFMIFGVSLRMFPVLLGVPEVARRRAWWAFGILTLAVAAESILFVVYRRLDNPVVAMLLMLPWLMLAIGSWMIASPWTLWKAPPIRERYAKFLRAAYAWLAVSLVMLLLLPVYHSLVSVPFSHAYYGAIRHAITVGFISMMIMGMAAKVVPTLNGVDPHRLTPLWGPFLLINLGCFLRVSFQTLTDWHPGFFAVVGVSGTLEVAALAWWGIGLYRIMRSGKRAEHETDADRAGAPHGVPRPITADSIVADVVRWYPQALPVLERHGFTMLRNPVARRTLARGVTLSFAASMRGVPLETLLKDLSAVAQNNRK